MRSRRSSPSQVVSRPSVLHQRHRRRGRGRRGLVAGAAGAQHRALRAVHDVPLGHAHVAAEHQFLLHHVLDGLDGHVGHAQRPGPLRHTPRQRRRGSRVGLQREERLAHRHLDLGLVPGDHLAGAPDEAQPFPARGRGRRGEGALDHQGLRHLVVAGGDERGLDKHGQVVDGEAYAAGGGVELGEPVQHPARGRAHQGPSRVVVGGRPAGGEREGHDGVGHHGAHGDRRERALAAVGGDHDHIDRAGVDPVQRGGDVEWRPFGRVDRRGPLDLQVAKDLIEIDQHRWSPIDLEGFPRPCPGRRPAPWAASAPGQGADGVMRPRERAELRCLTFIVPRRSRPPATTPSGIR